MIKRKRIRNVVSLLINILIVFFTAFAVSNGLRADVVHEAIWADALGTHMFRFFTVLSNLLVALASLVMIVFNVRNIVKDESSFPKWALYLKFSATCAVTVTFMTVVFFLAPTFMVAYKASYFFLFKGDNFFLHFFTPLLAIGSFLCCEKIEGFSLKYTVFGVIPTVLYSIVYSVMVVGIGEANGGWPDFYGFTFGGKTWAIPISLVVMYGVTFGFAVALRALQKVIFKRLEKEA